MTFNIFIYRLLLSIYLWVEAFVISYVIKSSYTNFYSNHQSLCILIISYTYNDIFSHFVLYSEFLMWFYFHFINNTLSDFHIFIFHFPFCDVSVLCLCYILRFFLSVMHLYVFFIYSRYKVLVKDNTCKLHLFSRVCTFIFYTLRWTDSLVIPNGYATFWCTWLSMTLPTYIWECDLLFTKKYIKVEGILPWD